NQFFKKLPFKFAAALLLLWLVVAGLLTVSRLTHPAFGVQGDLTLHYHITRSYAQSFAEGDPLPRWAGLLDGGRGDALFTFYPPLCYFASAVLMKAFRLDVLTSIKAVTFLVLFIAQASAYLLAREFFSRRRSLLVSLLFVLLPAYPLICLHRAFLANAFALSFAPPALLGAHRLLEGKRRASGLAIFALSFSAIVLTHAITTYLTALTIGLMTLVWLPRVGRRGLGRLAAAGAMTLTLVAFFLWPQVIEANWAQLKLQIVQQDYRNYFLFAKPANADRYRQAWAGVNDFTSFLILAQSFAALLLALLCYPLWRRHRLSPLVWFGAMLTVFGLVISLPASELLWRYLPGLKFIQFPWRFQPFVALGCALLAAIAAESWSLAGKRPRMLIAAALTWLVIANVIFTVMIARLDEKQVTRRQVAEVLAAAATPPITIEEGKRLQNEDDIKYLPYTANQIYFRPPGSDFNLYPPAGQPGRLTLVGGMIDGKSRVEVQKLEIAHREFAIENEAPTQARIETYNYPNWIAWLDDSRVEIKSEAGTGLMLIDLPAGQHRLSLSFVAHKTSERIAKWLSLIAWLALAGWPIVKRLRARR
ncbi:MAG TPA: 6-pyruvoyl-tetrahydropterin synthase-related protein, partial [Blastocatellia bacterium]|nr:6-pyruvoyl-tetrahydropterin synthase-related protein [Blastocatellia bacterium]